MINPHTGSQDTRESEVTVTAAKGTEKDHTILYQNTGKEKKGVSDSFVREALFNAIQALSQEVSKPTMSDQREGDVIDPLQYHVLLAKAREGTSRPS